MSSTQDMGLTTEGTDCKSAPAGNLFMKRFCFFILFVLSYNGFGQCSNEQISDRIEIDFQDFFANDKMTICVNGCLILKNQILTSDTLMGVGITGVSIIITNNTTKLAIGQSTTILKLPCSIVLTSTVRITTILNGYEENFDIDLNNGVYIGFSKKRDGNLSLLQSKIPFEYD